MLILECPGYDPVGNMTQFVQPTDDPRTVNLSDEYQAVYDAWNRLVEIKEPDGGGGWQPLETYQYDGRGFRIVKTKNPGSGETVRHSYYNNQWQLLEDRLGTSSTANRLYVWGMRYIDDLILSERTVDSTDYTLYAMQDANYNMMAIMEVEPPVGSGVNTTTIVERYDFLPYGEGYVLTPTTYSPKTDNESEYEWEILYAGYRYDSGTGLYCVRFRYYHAELGRWLQRDPIGYLGGTMNLYQYVWNSPLYYTDPLGLGLFGLVELIAIVVPIIILVVVFSGLIGKKAGEKAIEKLEVTYPPNSGRGVV